MLLVLSLCAAAFGSAVQPNAIGTDPWIKERAFGRESPGTGKIPTLGVISRGPGPSREQVGYQLSGLMPDF